MSAAQVIIGIILLAVLAGAGYGLYYLIENQSSTSTAAAATTTIPPPASTAAPPPPPPATPTTSTVSGAAVTCTSTQTPINGVCYDPCPTNYQPSTSDPTTCVATVCPDGSAATNGLCNRPTKTVSRVGAPSCPSGYTLYGNTCAITCPSGMVYDTTLQQCATDCKYGTNVSADGTTCDIPNATNSDKVSCPSGTTATYLTTSANGNAWAWICMKPCPNGWSIDNSETCRDNNGGAHAYGAICYGPTCNWEPPLTDVASVPGQTYSTAKSMPRQTSAANPTAPTCPAGSISDGNGNCYATCPTGYQNFGNVYNVCYESLANIPLSSTTLTSYILSQPRGTN